MDTARKAAYDALLAVERDGAYSNLALHRIIGRAKPADPGFVRELVCGVLARRNLLDYMLDAFLSKGMERTPLPARILLRMGLYQMDYMPHIPRYAAVNETVELAKAVCRGQKDLINGVLRRAAGGGARRMPVRPADASELAAYFSVRYSASTWLADLWIRAYGVQRAEAMLAESLTRAPLCLRVHTARITPAALMERLTAETDVRVERSAAWADASAAGDDACRGTRGGNAGTTVRIGTLSPRSLVLTAPPAGLFTTQAYREGLFSAQDQAATYAADCVQAAPGQLIVDVCAAPGGKSMALAEEMQGRGRLYAFDVHAHRLSLIERERQRLGLPEDLVTALCRDARSVCETLRGQADSVLADVPCSGLGVLRRKPELKYRVPATGEMEELLTLQGQILAAASAYVKPGGLLVYSTCTVNPAENEQQIERFLATRTDFIVCRREQLWPAKEHDGFFVCGLKREG